jgi:YbgC/YbaW family acyl-CoA thioester hydrolase
MSASDRQSFEYRHQVQFVDTDMIGIVHFSNFFRYMEAAEDAFLKHVGVPLLIEEDGVPISFPRLAAQCSFLSPIRYPDLVAMEVTIRELGPKKVRFGFHFRVNDRDCADGEILAICCKLGAKMHSIAIPTVIREKLEPHVVGRG